MTKLSLECFLYSLKIIERDKIIHLHFVRNMFLILRILNVMFKYGSWYALFVSAQSVAVYRWENNLVYLFYFSSSISSSKSGRLERDLLQSIETEAAEILTKLGSAPPRQIVHQESLRNVAVQLGRLKNNVDRALDTRLDFYIEVNISPTVT